MILAIDPGLHHCGTALFLPSGELHTAALVSNYASGRGPEAWRGMADAVAGWVRTPELLVIEGQQVHRRGRRARVRADDLLQLTGIVGAITVALGCPVKHHKTPRDWKGTLDADVMLRRIEKTLTSAELTRIGPCPKSLRHNVLDAIGIGLHHFGRLNPVVIVR